MFIWLASAQYAAPVLRNSLNKIITLDFASIIERLMKLSTISLIIWLAGFFAIFQSILNALAEIMRFGDREFYSDWWNSPSVGAYWRSWNKPVYSFMRRHIYSPLVGRGWSSNAASAMVFVFSGFLHELAVGVPTHNILGLSLPDFHPPNFQRGRMLKIILPLLGVAFIGMIVQLPLVSVTLPLEKMQGKNGKVLGNCIFWISFCLVGQPLAALLYFFAWQAKYGSVSKNQVR
jgi:diacylglycerol O-acyltransferase-1